MANKKSTKTSRTTATRTNAKKNNNTFRARNDREKKMMIFIAILAVALVSTIGIALAAFSTDLQINGSAIVKSTSWDIHFDKLQTVALTGKAKEVTAPTIQDSATGAKSTVIKEYEIELKNPGDSAEYTFDVVNAGDLDAEITAIVMHSDIATDPKAITCTTVYADDDADKNTEDATTKKAREDKVCENINYTLKYADDNSNVAVGDTLDKATSSADTKRTMKLKLELDPSMQEKDLPNKDVKVTGLGITITYGQKATI